MDRKPLPPVELLRELLEYDPVDGTLRWRPRPAETFATPRAAKTWNSRFAGARAGAKKHAGRNLVVRIDDHGRYPAPRIAWAVHHGRDGDGEISVADGDCTNLRLANLRDLPPGEHMAERSRQYWSCPAARAKQSRRASAAMTPEVIERLTKAREEARSDPERAARWRRNMSEAWDAPGRREGHSRAMRAAWRRKRGDA